jgi:hypothetical protein
MTVSDRRTKSGYREESPVARLYLLQRRRRERLLATAFATLVGLAAGTVHWSGLLVGGALVGLARPTLRRALVAGLGFAVLVLVAAAVEFALAGVLDRSLAMGPLLWVGTAIGVVAPVLGATVRGLFRDAPPRPPD